MPDTFRFDLEAKRISTDANLGAPVALFSDLSTDTVYAVEGTTIKAVHGGASTTGTWRSRCSRSRRAPTPASRGAADG